MTTKLTTDNHPNFKIEITDNQSGLAVDEEFLRQAVQRTLSLEKIAAAEISVAVIDNAEIWELNRRYLQHDYATDVLSFLLESDFEERPALSQGSPPGQGVRISGEIVVSAEMAAERATEFGWRAQDELLLYVVHGLLHLCGYDDQTEEDRTIMRRREREVLSTWDIESHGSESNTRSMS